MKTAITIFTVVGVIANFLIATTTLGYIAAGIGVLVGTFMLVTVFEDEKYTTVGVLAIIFTGIVAGILYLSWEPEE